MPAHFASPPAQSAPHAASETLLNLACCSVIGLLALSLLAVLQIASDIVVPIFAAILFGVILAHISDRLTGLGLDARVSGALVVTTTIGAGALLINGVVEPFSALVARAPEMVKALSTMADPLLRPLADLRAALFHAQPGVSAEPALGGEATWVASFLGRLTPAVGQLMVFFTSLGFFVAGRATLRRKLILSMPERRSRLAAIRTIAAVEEALAHYFGTTALVYVSVGCFTALIAFAFGLADPLMWGAMSFAAAYIPYLGVSLITLSLAACGVLTKTHALVAFAPAALYLGVHTLSEMFVIPMLLGRRHEINPFLIFLSIVFWSWMWGPVGAILASPILITLMTLADALSEKRGQLP